MKKKYTEPAMGIVNIEPQDIIASSPISFTNEGGSGVLNDDLATDDALSKDNNGIWED